MMQLDRELQGVSTVAISGHVRPDGDCVGACVGLWHYIRDNFKQIEVDIWLQKPDEKFAVLEGFDKIHQVLDEEKHYDLFISLDCATYERLGESLRYFDSAKKTICIDHHISNAGYANLNEVQADRKSVV